ncbi:UNVERIFIED_CONTAM: hypothetical protein Sradi_4157800 [Sesamum radiatum]|uniref:Retrotransposon Copia-like N-terminal domain-containing protein n=1 Tax=Sesamum radiatum TaxID=300843 RepID=A0AAW2P3G2_SESRA
MLPERLNLHTGDHPGMSLVSTLLDGRNYLPWSRSVILALGAKQTLGFVDGTCEKPLGNKDEIEQWERVDCVVIAWLRHSCMLLQHEICGKNWKQDLERVMALYYMKFRGKLHLLPKGK